MEVFGHTRSRLTRDHALITPDTHVESPLVGWENSLAVVHISPKIGARFQQYTVIMDAGGRSGAAGTGVERFVYVLDGGIEIEVDGKRYPLPVGGYAFVPADVEHSISAQQKAKLIVFEKLFQPLSGFAQPKLVVGNAQQIEGLPFMGDPDARLQTLLPVSFEFDVAVNIFTYQPGATLPQVEMHVMEHGLQMIAGQGIYRLSDSYYPVISGDVIWMASWCPQWFVAMGKEPASYIYYKDIHRDSLNGS